MKRLLLYTHYNLKEQVSDYVIYQLEKLSPLFDQVVFISNSSLKEADQDKIAAISSKISMLQRENLGYDFSAWKEAMTILSWSVIDQFDSLTLMNDTCFGPLFDVTPIYRKYEIEGVDFWGLTCHPEAQLTRRIRVQEHLQSYFLVFHQSVLRSATFKEFWMGVQALEDLQEVIRQYEAGLTSHLVKAGFSFASLLTDKTAVNLSMERPDLILEHRVPFIKIKSFHHRSDLNSYLLKEISTVTDYPIALVVNALAQRYPQPLPGIFTYQLLIEEGDKHDLAVHLHFYTEDFIDLFFDRLSCVQLKKLVITYSTDALKKYIFQKLKSFNFTITSIQLSKGNDWQALIKVKDYFEEEDDIIHLHNRLTGDGKLQIKHDLKYYLTVMLNDRLVIPERDYGILFSIDWQDDDLLARKQKVLSRQFKEFSNQYYPLFDQHFASLPFNYSSFFIIKKKRILDLLSRHKQDLDPTLLPLDLWILGYNNYYFIPKDHLTSSPQVTDLDNYRKSWLLTPTLFITVVPFKEILLYLKNGFSLVKKYVKGFLGNN